jgi:hypothetical protein
MIQLTRHLLRGPRGLFIGLFLLGLALRVGYGIARYGGDLLHSRDGAFIGRWDYDAAEHVAIAHALLSGQGHLVADLPELQAKHARGVGQDAIFKAPLYQFMLAGLFGFFGFSFIPLLCAQAILGGLLSGLWGVLTLTVFQQRATAWFAGLTTAFHPVLVNSASQPYNENLYFFLFAATLCMFFRWLRGASKGAALAFGLVAGLWILTRDSAFSIVVVLLLVAAWWCATRSRPLGHVALMTLATVLMISPWTLRNYWHHGLFVPVASIVGAAFLEGNNPCVAPESLFTPFWGEGPCKVTDEKRAQALASLKLPEPISMVWKDRIAGRIAAEFIVENPLSYLKLTARRLWTVLLPFNPRAEQGLVQRFAFTMYWLVVVPAGLVGIAMSVRWSPLQPRLLALVAAASLATLAAVVVWSDLRYRVGLDVILGSFAGWVYSRLAARVLPAASLTPQQNSHGSGLAS